MGGYEISSDALGVTYLFTGDIFIFENGKMFEKIVTHEVGHIIVGAWHSDDAKSIMYPYTSDNTQIYIMKEEVNRIKQRIIVQ